MNIDMIDAAAARPEGPRRGTPLLSSPFSTSLPGAGAGQGRCLQHTGYAQVPRRLVGGLGAAPARSGRRGDRLLLGQPRAGRGAGDADARRAPRHAVNAAQTRRAKLANYPRPGARRRSLLRDPAGRRTATRIGARAQAAERGLSDPDQTLRRPAGDRRPRHHWGWSWPNRQRQKASRRPCVTPAATARPRASRWRCGAGAGPAPARSTRRSGRQDLRARCTARSDRTQYAPFRLTLR